MYFRIMPLVPEAGVKTKEGRRNDTEYVLKAVSAVVVDNERAGTREYRYIASEQLQHMATHRTHQADNIHV